MVNYLLVNWKKMKYRDWDIIFEINKISTKQSIQFMLGISKKVKCMIKKDCLYSPIMINSLQKFSMEESKGLGNFLNLKDQGEKGKDRWEKLQKFL